MFLSAQNLNEGGCQDKCSDSKKRELYEGENPKSTNETWQASKREALVNSNWQKLRK